jgi:cobalt transporter subunit CbtB
MTTSQSTAAQPAVAARAGALPAILAMAAGMMLLLVVGFAGPQVLHNAAHDSRHALSFPCH